MTKSVKSKSTKPAPTAKPKLPYHTPQIVGPIPAPVGFNYTGILEQIAQSLQDLVAEAKAISEIPSLLDDVLGELKTMSTSMSTLSASLEEYLKVVDDDEGVDAVTIRILRERLTKAEEYIQGLEEYRQPSWTLKRNVVEEGK